MAARLSAKRLPRYSLDFKLKAVKLTRLPGMEVQAVAEALDLHPVMLSRWRQESREGRLRDTAPRPRSRRSWCERSSVCRIWSRRTRCSRRSMNS